MQGDGRDRHDRRLGVALQQIDQRVAFAALVEVAALAEPDQLAAASEANVFEIQNLAIGKTAPEIEGEDVAGVAFKLSDYRGKVVMLDFWGFW